MSDRTLTAKIVATDGASPVFKQVANGAQQMGTAVSTAGTHAAAGMKQAEESGGRLKSVYENLRGAGASLGIALSSVGEIFGEVARASEEASASEERLKTAVEDTGASWDTYSAAIERTLQTGHDLAFSHEEVEGALSNLVTITKDAGTALQDLALSEDVARARGISLESAALAVGRAAEGNTAALSRLGFKIDATATSTEQLAVVQQQAAGQAQAFAATSAGSFDRVKDSIHNMMIEVGDHLGPMQTLLALLPGLSAGGTLVAGAFGELAEVFLRDEVAAEEDGAAHAAAAAQLQLWTVAEEEATVATGEAAVATEALGAASAEAGIASAAFDLALGPVGLAAAALAATAAIIGLTSHADAYDTVAGRAGEVTSSFAAELGKLQGTGSAAAADFQKVSDAFTGLIQKEVELSAAIAANASQQGGATAASISALDEDQINTIKKDILDLFQNPFIDSGKISAELTSLFAKFDDGSISADDLTAAIEADASQWYKFTSAADTASHSVDDLKRAFEGLPPADTPGLMDRLTDKIKGAKAAIDPLTESVGKWSDKNKTIDTDVQTLGDYARAAGQSGDAADQFAADLQTLADAGGDSAVVVESIYKQLAAGTITLGQAEKEAANYANSLRQQALASEQATDAENRADRAVSDGIVAKMAAIQAQRQFNDSVYASFQALGILASMDKDWATNTDAVTGAIKRTHDALGQMTPAEEAARSGIARTAAAMDDEAKKFAAMSQSVLDAANALGVMNSLAQQIQPINLKPFGADRATSATVDLQRTGSALDSVLNIYKEIDDLGKKSSDANSIAENLVGKPGEWATIDDMLKSGAISLTRYNETVEAGYRIEQRQKSVEEELNVIRAKQIPLLDQQDQAYQREIKAISHMSAQQQEVALGFLDTNEAAKAQQAVTLAASAAMGELGDHGEQAARKIIKGAIEADPVLKSMLESIGLVTEDKDGTIHIHFDNATNLHKDLQEIKTDIDALIRVLGGIPPDVKTKVSGDASGAIQAGQHATAAMSAAANHDWTVSIGGDPSGATQAASDATGALSGLTSQDWTVGIGADATNFYGVVNGILGTTLGQAFIEIDAITGIGGAAGQAAINAATGGGRLGGVADHLVVPSYARGGVVAQLAEIGPEMVTAPGGHQFMAWNHGVYSVPSGSYVNDAASTASKMGSMGGGVTVTFTGPINGFAGMDDLMAAAARSARAHLAGLGL